MYQNKQLLSLSCKCYLVLNILNNNTIHRFKIKVKQWVKSGRSNGSEKMSTRHIFNMEGMTITDTLGDES